MCYGYFGMQLCYFGISIQKVEPTPGDDFTPTLPPMRKALVRQIDNPNPMPGTKVSIL